MYVVYILFSDITNKYYVGSTKDIQNRLSHHNCGATPSTKAGAPNWKVVYIEHMKDKSDALKRELDIKNKKSRKYIEYLISSADT